MFNPASTAAIEAATSMLLQSISNGELAFGLISTRTEKTDFLQVDSYVKALDGTIKAISDALKLHRCNFAARRNSLVPLGRLPVEILSTIFTFAVSDNYSYDFRLRLQHLYQLRAVSKTFRSIINQSPTLWTSIPSNCPPPVVSEALLRSKPLPILIYGHEDGQQDIDDSNGKLLPTNSDFLEAVMVHIDRWDRAFLTFPCTDALQKTLIKPAPRLKEISLAVSIRENSQDVAATYGEIFRGQIGQLDRLHLFGVSLRWDSAIFKGLKWLTVSNPSGQLEPSAQDILQILSSSPSLRVLDLSDLYFESTPPPTSWPLVQLDDLEELALSCVHSNIIDAILSHIVAHACVVVHVTTEMSATRAESFVEREILPKFPALHSAISLSQRSELVLGEPRSPMVVWRSSVSQTCGRQAEIALEIGDGGRTDYSSTVKVLFPDRSGSRDGKLRLHKRFLCETQWTGGHIQAVLGSRRHFTEVEIDLPGERDMNIWSFLDSNLYPSINHVILPSMSLLLIRGSAWSSAPLVHALNNRKWGLFDQVTSLRVVVHESVDWDDDELDALRNCRAVKSVEWMEAADE